MQHKDLNEWYLKVLVIKELKLFWLIGSIKLGIKFKLKMELETGKIWGHRKYSKSLNSADSFMEIATYKQMMILQASFTDG